MAKTDGPAEAETGEEGQPSCPSSQPTQSEFFERQMSQVFHEVANCLAPIRTGLEVMRKQPSFTGSAALNLVERNVRKLAEFLQTARDEKMGTCEIGKFAELLRTLVAEIHERRERLPEVEILPPPPELESAFVPINRTLWAHIMENLMSNAARKGAKRMRVTFGATSLHRAGVPGALIAIRDDGDGMDAARLALVRAGDPAASDREATGDLPQGDRPEHHGHGIPFVRRVVTELSLGELDIDSVQRVPGGPPDHGTEIRIGLPMFNGHHEVPVAEVAEPDAAPAPSPDASVTAPAAAEPPAPGPSDDEDSGDFPPFECAPEPPKTIPLPSRRAVVVGGGIAAAVLIAIGKVVQDRYGGEDGGQAHAVKEPESIAGRSPLRAFEVDGRGRISFTLETGGRRIDYAPGMKPPALGRVSTIEHEQGSMVGFDLDGETSYLCHLPQGVFCYFHALQQGHKTGYVCVPRAVDGRIDVGNAPYFAAEDTLHNRNGAFIASNKALLAPDVLGAVMGTLKQFSGVGNLPNAEQRKLLNHLRRTLAVLHPVFEREAQAAYAVNKPDDWERCLAEATKKLVVVERPAQERLERSQRTPQEIAALRRRENDLCFVAMDMARAQKLVRR